MKRLLLCLPLILNFLLPVRSMAQTVTDSISVEHNICNTIDTDSILLSISEDVSSMSLRELSMNPERGRYKLYPTENVYNLLKLDTATGRLWQVQWSLNSNEEMTVSINSRSLSYNEKIGTFELYPTQNMYQFILLDTTNGRTWHIQWGTNSKKRWIRPVY